MEKGLNMLMERKAIAILALVLLSGSVFAESISNYTVSNSIPMHDTLTIYGVYNNPDGNSGVLCAFYIFDLANNDTNRALIRLNDQYTFSDGSFYNQINLQEPLFRTGLDYNAITKCNGIQIGKKFYIDQREDVAFGFIPSVAYTDLLFWKNPYNQMVTLALAIVIICMMVIGAWILNRAH